MARIESGGPTSLGQDNGVFRRGMAETFVLDVAARALSAISVVVLIRGLGVSSYAFVTLFLILAQFLGSAAGGGVRLRYLRREAERFSRGERDPAASFAGALVSSSFLVVVIALAVLPVVYFFVGVPAGGDPIGLVLYSIGFAIGASAVELVIVHYQAQLRFVWAGAVGVLRSATVLAVSIVVVAMDADRPPTLPLWFVGGMMVAAALVVLRIPRARRWSGEGQPRPRLSLTSEEAWLTVYFLAASGFAYVNVLIAGAFLTTSDIATLGAALRYFAIVMAAIPAIGAVLRVRAAQFDVVDSGENQRRLVLSWLRATALVSVGLLVVSMVLTPFVVPLIDGGRYPGSVIALQIFLVSAACAYMTEPSPNVLMAQNQYSTLALLFGLALIASLVVGVLVAPRWGVTGIAVVSSFSFVALRVALTVVCLRVASRAASAPGIP